MFVVISVKITIQTGNGNTAIYKKCVCTYKQEKMSMAHKNHVERVLYTKQLTTIRTTGIDLMANVTFQFHFLLSQRDQMTHLCDYIKLIKVLNSPTLLKSLIVLYKVTHHFYTSYGSIVVGKPL